MSLGQNRGGGMGISEFVICTVSAGYVKALSLR